VTRRVSAAFCAAVLLAAAALATTVRPVSVETLTQQASTVVEARAMESWSAWDDQQHLIFTYTKFQVSKALKGAPGHTITVKQLGGSARGFTQKVSGVRHFIPGEETVLFLTPSDAHDGSMAVVGLMQGQFRVHRSSAGEATVTNGMPDVQQLSNGRVVQYSGDHMSLNDLEQRVKGANLK